MASENLTRDEARDRAALLSTDSYDIRLDLTSSTETFVTETTIRFSSTEARGTFVDLIARAVTEIELNGELLSDPASRFDGARVALPELALGENTVRILAEGVYMNTGEGLHRFSTRSTTRCTCTPSSRSRTHGGCSPASSSPISRRPSA